jgi:hypothetical protein
VGVGAYSLASEGLGESRFRRGDIHCDSLYIRVPTLWICRIEVKKSNKGQNRKRGVKKNTDPEANIQGGEKPFTSSFNICAEAYCRKWWERADPWMFHIKTT